MADDKARTKPASDASDSPRKLELNRDDLKDLDASDWANDADAVKGGACENRSCWVSCVYTK